MKRVIAIWTGGLMAAAGAWGGAAAQTAAVPAAPALAAQRTDAPIPAPAALLPEPPERPAATRRRPLPFGPAFVSGETTGSTAKQEPAGAVPAAEGDGHAPPPTRAPMPFDIIRTLQFLQDQIARGNARAIRVQAMLLRRFGPTLLEADRSVWDDVRNRRAAILFALSGGPPEVLRKLIADDVFDEATKPIAEAALAYVSNDLRTAERLLSPVDLAKAEPGLAAHLSLVLGQLKQDDHPAEAVAALDRARLLAPGGLIEEAALRLEMVLADKLGDHARADDLARQYFDRFSRSSYIGNFQARFAMVYTDRGNVDAAAALATAMDVTARLDGPNKRALLLAISRRSLVAGNLELARLSGAEALKIEGTEGEDLQRGNLYALAAGLAASDPAGSANELRSIDRTMLHPADLGILDAAASVLSGMGQPPPSEPASIDAKDIEPSPVFDRAQKLLDAVAGDLGDKS